MPPRPASQFCSVPSWKVSIWPRTTAAPRFGCKRTPANSRVPRNHLNTFIR